ncbi:MAG TPA: RNA polymerase sigma factor [Gemmatales bacterium]|nr:RNA polymerase sigma factor [Gemmatales bacterium]HMP59917.1 RNA polymerase sigma factor [Gemmatales bacterium]
MPQTVDERVLIQRCLTHDVGAWNDFVDRFSGLIYRVIHFTAHLRSVDLAPDDVEDIAAEIMLKIVANNYALLRQFQGRSSLSTYLAVIARRICVHELVKRVQIQQRQIATANGGAKDSLNRAGDASLETLDEVQNLLGRLPKKVREAVRLFYLEGRSYEEISARLNIPVNSIGPMLARAKGFLRQRMQQRFQAPPAPKKAKK